MWFRNPLQLMYHVTSEENVETILREGLKINQPYYLTEGAEWTTAYYGVNPIFLSVEPWITDAKTIAWGIEEKEPLALAILKVDVAGLDLVADLASLVDRRAYFDEGYFWWKYDHEIPPSLKEYHDSEWGIDIDFLIEPSPIADAAIGATGTAACLEDISPERIEFVSYTD